MSADYIAEWVCAECGKEFRDTSRRGIGSHYRAKHPEADLPPEMAPVKASRTRAAQASVPAAKDDLKTVEKELIETIAAAGSLIAAVLGSVKEHAVLMRVQGTYLSLAPGARRGPLARLPERFQLPIVETTLGHVIIDQAPLSTRIIMDRAASSPALLRWVRRVNGWVHGSGDAQVITTHLAGLVHSAAPEAMFVQRYLNFTAASAMKAVEAENEALRREIARLRYEQTMGSAPGPESDDERGGG